jgi:hypothetical protein
MLVPKHLEKIGPELVSVHPGFLLAIAARLAIVARVNWLCLGNH